MGIIVPKRSVLAAERKAAMLRRSRNLVRDLKSGKITWDDLLAVDRQPDEAALPRPDLGIDLIRRALSTAPSRKPRTPPVSIEDQLSAKEKAFDRKLAADRGVFPDVPSAGFRNAGWTDRQRVALEESIPERYADRARQLTPVVSLPAPEFTMPIDVGQLVGAGSFDVPAPEIGAPALPPIASTRAIVPTSRAVTSPTGRAQLLQDAVNISGALHKLTEQVPEGWDQGAAYGLERGDAARPPRFVPVASTQGLKAPLLEFLASGTARRPNVVDEQLEAILEAIREEQPVTAPAVRLLERGASDAAAERAALAAKEASTRLQYRDTGNRLAMAQEVLQPQLSIEGLVQRFGGPAAAIPPGLRDLMAVRWKREIEDAIRPQATAVATVNRIARAAGDDVYAQWQAAFPLAQRLPPETWLSIAKQIEEDPGNIAHYLAAMKSEYGGARIYGDEMMAKREAAQPEGDVGLVQDPTAALTPGERAIREAQDVGGVVRDDPDAIMRGIYGTEPGVLAKKSQLMGVWNKGLKARKETELPAAPRGMYDREAQAGFQELPYDVYDVPPKSIAPGTVDPADIAAPVTPGMLADVDLGGNRGIARGTILSYPGSDEMTARTVDVGDLYFNQAFSVNRRGRRQIRGVNPRGNLIYGALKPRLARVELLTGEIVTVPIEAVKPIARKQTTSLPPGRREQLLNVRAAMQRRLAKGLPGAERGTELLRRAGIPEDVIPVVPPGGALKPPRPAELTDISSRSLDPLGRALTNVTRTHYLIDEADLPGLKRPSAGRSAEHWYKANKTWTGTPEERTAADEAVMQQIIAAKLRRHPSLADGISARGGSRWILEHTRHVVGVKGSRWEGVGEQSRFLRVLARAYDEVRGGTGTHVEPVRPEVGTTYPTTTTIPFSKMRTFEPKSVIEGAEPPARITPSIATATMQDVLRKLGILEEAPAGVVTQQRLASTERAAERVAPLAGLERPESAGAPGAPPTKAQLSLPDRLQQALATRAPTTPVFEKLGQFGKAMRAPALALAGATLAQALAPSEAEAGILSPRKGAVVEVPGRIGEIGEAQRAPTVRVPTQPWHVRFKQDWVDSLYNLERILLRTSGGKEARAEFGSVVNAGMGPADTITRGLADSYEDVERQGLGKVVSAALNLGAYEREWTTISHKIDVTEARIRHFERRGMTREAEAARDSIADLVRGRTEKTLTPMKMDADQLRAERQALLAGLTPEQQTSVARAVDSVHAVTRGILNMLDQEGFMDPKFAEGLRSRGSDYIPLPRIFDLYDAVHEKWVAQQYAKGPRDKASRTKLVMQALDEDEFKGMRGSDLINVDPWVAVTRFINDAVNDIQSNRAARVFLTRAGAESDAIKDVAVVRKLDAPLQGRELERLQKQGLEQVSYMENGQAVPYLVDRDIADALGTVDIISSRQMLRSLGTWRRYFHASAATANAAFILAQIPMDIGAGALVPSYSRYVKGGLLKDLAGTYLPTIIKMTLDGVVGQRIERLLGKDVFGSTTRYNAMIDKLRKAGAIGRSLGGFMDAERQVRGWVPEQGLRKGASYIERVVEGPTEFWLEPFENALKGGAYETLKKRGYERDFEAGFEAKRYAGSPDFNRFGFRTRGWPSQLFMFLNPTIQGIDRLAVKIGEDPKRIVKSAAALSAALAALYWHNYDYRDEEGNPEIDKIPRNIRRDNLIIFKNYVETLSTGERRRPFYTIPLPREFRALLAPLTTILQAARGEPEYGYMQAAVDTLEHWIPGGASLDAKHLLSSAGRRFLGALNPVLRAPIESFANVASMTGAPVVGTRVAGRRPESQWTTRTDPTARKLAELIGATFPGAPERLRSPDALQHLMMTFFPGAGEMLLSAGQVVNKRPASRTGVETATERAVRMPGLGVAARRFVNPGVVSQERLDAMNDLYEAQRQLSQAAATPMSILRRSREEFEKLPMEEIGPKAARFRALAPISAGLSAIAAERERLQTDLMAGLTPEERLTQLEQLFKTEQNVLRIIRPHLAEWRKEGIIR